ncbi:MULTISPECIES: inositol monophosphatase family protein [unclassified Crossiella]|uniref:inositol monophosphatase family protein n=1 Tax=unclassified Crossiella TaxID=2620835 RepID=UPI001FFFDD0C|nr:MULTISPECIES: inositol monophosphatase family protein [unclassified Crossiella]MCK2239972.1 inositol monophosphatase [Crossiella sp. S99.2]MCK2252680.1 inositol monophosphatase [Crossiella sp. S99.1]
MTVIGVPDHDLHVRDLQHFCEQIAREAGSWAMAWLDRHRSYSPTRLSSVEHKASATDLVTEADREIERLLGHWIATQRPGEPVVGEEFGGSGESHVITWVLDPIDGTTNFAQGLPFWAISVAAVYNTVTVAACVHAPALGWTFTAAEGCGARFRAGNLPAHQMSVSTHEDFGSSLVATGYSYNAEQKALQARLSAELINAVGDIRRCGSAALDLCMVGAGLIDGFFEHGLGHWDWAGGSLIALEAGAILRTPARDVNVDDGLGGDCVFAAAPGIAAALERLLREAGAQRLTVPTPDAHGHQCPY